MISPLHDSRPVVHQFVTLHLTHVGRQVGTINVTGDGRKTTDTDIFIDVFFITQNYYVIVVIVYTRFIGKLKALIYDGIMHVL